MPVTSRCQLPLFPAARPVWVRSIMSATLKMAVTRNTAVTMHRMVSRFCRLRTLAEMGIRLR
jgi:hypothetical protein